MSPKGRPGTPARAGREAAPKRVSAEGSPGGWDALERELDRWVERGRAATFWWRDDDAVAMTPHLAPLLDLAARHGVPVALAAIPAGIEPSLAEAIAHAPLCTVVQHGYSHSNHAAAGERSRELGGERSATVVEQDLRLGAARLRGMFGARFVPIIVPPWNRIDERVVQRLPGLGCIGLSTFGPRVAREPVAGLVQVNTHVDPIGWRTGRAFVGALACCERIVAHLEQRRCGAADPREPTGLLTHHLVFDDAAWRCVDELLARTLRHPAARWVPVADAFATSDRAA